MDEEARQHRHSVPTQLPAQSAGILHVQDLPGNQEYDPEGKVPEEEEGQKGRRLMSRWMRGVGGRVRSWGRRFRKEGEVHAVSGANHTAALMIFITHSLMH